MTVIDVRTGHRLPERTVVIAGTRIRVLGRTGQVRVPRGAHIVEAQGKYLIPGLWDMHVHPWTGFGPYSYLLFLANGVTGVRDAGDTVSLATFKQWKREIAEGTRLSPRLFVAGPSVNEIPPLGLHQIAVTTPEIAAQRVDTVRARWVVDSLYAAGADFIKPYNLSEATYFIMAAEARRLGMPFGGHEPGAWAVQGGRRGPTGASNPGITGRVVDSGVRFIDHFLDDSPWRLCGDTTRTRLTPSQCAAAVVRRFRQHDTWLVTGNGSLPFPRMKYELLQRFFPNAALEGRDSLAHVAQGAISRDSALAWLRADSDFARPLPTSIADWLSVARARGWGRNTGEESREPDLGAAGLPVLLGTDTPIGGIPGFAVHSALAKFVVYGRTPLAVLQTATLNPALALHATDSLGTVEAGKLADLVLLDADPLTDITNTSRIRAVVANGRYYDRAALDGLLDEAERAAHR